MRESTNPLDSAGSGARAGLDAVERERAEPDDADEPGGVLAPVPEGAGEVDVGGEVGGVRLHLRGDVGDEGQELLVEVGVRFGPSPAN